MKSRRPIQKNITKTTHQKIKLLCDRIRIRLTELKTLFSHYEEISAINRLDAFLDDPITALAGHYLISCFREDVQTLWNILSSAASGQENALSKSAAILDHYILIAKAILHNHDEISSLTRSGENLVVLFRDLPLLLEIGLG